MIASAGRYYWAAFKGSQGVMQGNLLSPTIFNLVVDAVMRHWVAVMAEGAEERDERGQEGRHNNPLLYEEHGMAAFLDPQCLQGSFITLVGLFDRVVLCTNVGKTVGMVYRPCQAAGTQSEAMFNRRIMVEGPSYQERQKGRVQCRECGEEMAAGSLARHMTTQNRRFGRVEMDLENLNHGREPRTYRAVFLAKGGPWSCLVEGCP